MLKKRTTILAGIFLFLVISTASFAQTQQEILVSAAISLKDAFTNIGKAFEAKNKNVKVVLNFGASGDLKTQILGGAPVDVFASAAQKEMNELEKNNKIIRETRVDFAGNGVVLIVPADSRAQIQSFADLQKPEIKKFSIGNPKTVPAGRYADEVLTYYKLKDAGTLDKCVYGEHVRQVLDYVARKEVDAGIVYATDAQSRAGDVKVVVAAPAETHKPIIYPLAVVAGSKNKDASDRLISFTLSKEGQQILKKHGFLPGK